MSVGPLIDLLKNTAQRSAQMVKVPPQKMVRKIGFPREARFAKGTHSRRPLQAIVLHWMTLAEVKSNQVNQIHLGTFDIQVKLH